MLHRVAFVAFALTASAVHADALLDQALANGGPYDGAAWAYTSTTEVSSGGSTVLNDAFERLKHGERQRPPVTGTRVVRYDPSRPAGQRQTVVRATGGDVVQIDAKESDAPLAYADLRGLVQGQPKLVAKTPTTATYRFSVDPAKVRKLGGTDLDIDADGPLPPLAGIAVVRTTGAHAPYISIMTVTLPAGPRGRGNAVGKVRQLSMGLRFAPDPSRGVQLLRAFGVDASFQALGLVGADLSVLNRLGDYRYVGK